MPVERRNALRYSVAVSIGLHLVALSLVGRGFSAQPGIDIDSLRVVDVAVATGGLQPEEALRQAAKERGVVLPRPAPQATAPKRLVSQKPMLKLPPRVARTQPPAAQPRQLPKPPAPQPSRAVRYSPGQTPSAAPQPPGDPGGPLNLGSTSERGQDLGPAQGTTPMGSVPNPEGVGSGSGSGTGPGVGPPEPPKVADAGPGTRANPAPPASSPVAPAAAERPKPKPPEPPPPKPEPPRREETPKPPEPPPMPDRRDPELISMPDVDKYYPPSAREEGVEGKVTVLYTVSEDGSVTDAQVTKSSGDARLDQAALRLVRAMKYKPAVQDGKPHPVRCLRSISFQLN